MVKNITLNKHYVIYNIISEVTIPSLKYVEKRTRNKLKIKVFVIKRGFYRQTLLGLTGSFWSSKLGQIGLLEKTLLRRTGLL